VLARSKKRYYVAYEYKRTVNIWERRDDFLAYEQALILEAQVDALLDGSTLATRAPRKLGVSSVASSHKRNASRRAATQTPKKRLKTTRDTPVVVEEEEEEDTLTPRQQAAQEVVKLINDQVLPVWRELVHIKSEAEPRTRGLERFESGR
jgi:Fanconi-associated nuclease 1